MTQIDLFDAAAAYHRQSQGMSKVMSDIKNRDWILEAKEIAVSIAKHKGRVTADDLNRSFPRPQEVSPSCLGVVFKDKRFMMIGFEASSRVTRRGGTNKVYCLRD